MELLWSSLGSLTAGAAVVWSIFTFIIDKRDKAHNEEKQEFYKYVYALEDRLEKEMQTIRFKQDQSLAMMGQVNLTVELQKEKFNSMTEKFIDYSKEVRKIIEKHSEEIIHLGKVIRINQD